MLEEIVTAEVLSAIIIGGILALGGFFTTMYRCLRKQGNRGYRQSQAIMILTQCIEEQTKTFHPEHSGDLTGKVERILLDEKGNL